MARHEEDEASGNRYALLIGLVAVVLVAASAFGRVYQGTGTTFRLMLAAVVATALAHALARRHVLLATAVSAAGLLVAIGLLVFPDTVTFGLPTVRTVKAIATGLSSVSREAALTVAPALPAGPLLLAGVIAVWTAAFASHALVIRARSPFLALLPAAALLGFAGIVVDDGTRPGYVVFFLAGALTVLFADAVGRVGHWGPVTVWHGRRFLGLGSRTTTRGAWRVAMASLGVSLFLPWVLPGFGSTGLLRLQSGEAQAVSINPIVDIRPRLIHNPPTLFFSVRTDHPSYWRLLADDQFDGRIWSSSDPEASHGLTVASGPLPGVTTGLPADDVIQATEQFEFARLTQPWLPTGYQPLELGLPRGQLRYDPSSGTLVLPDLTYPGLAYEVRAQLVSPTPDELDAVPSLDQPDAARYTTLPADTPHEIFQIAQAWSASGVTPFQKIMAIQEHLRSFTYNLNVQAPRSTNDLLYFLLKSHQGYCEQFAGSMAVLLRALGFPTRVAVGFTPGTYDARSGIWRVRSTDVHTWVEVLFPRFGWLAFEPTPSRSNPVASRYDQPPPNIITGGVTSCAELPAQGAACPASAPGVGKGRIQQRKGGPKATNPDIHDLRGGRTFGNGGFALPPPHRRDWSGPALVAALALFGLLAFGVPLGKAARRRAILARAGPRPSQRVLAAYRVMADGAADVGLGRRAAETIQEYRGRLAGTVRFTNGDFDTLTALAGRAAYAEDGLSAADGRRAVTLARTASRDIRRSAGRPRLILGLYRLERPSFLRPSDG